MLNYSIESPHISRCPSLHIICRMFLVNEFNNTASGQNLKICAFKRNSFYLELPTDSYDVGGTLLQPMGARFPSRLQESGHFEDPVSQCSHDSFNCELCKWIQVRRIKLV
jgi:hypothetical protein